MHNGKNPAPTDTPIHEILAHRWSPRAFDAKPVEPEKLRALFEAARWASSSYNAQPWHFIVATKNDPVNFKKVLECFVEFNQGWAKNAPVVAISVAATMALQATALGLQVHQMAGIMPEKAREVFRIPEGYEAVAGIALGYPGDPASLPDQLRERELGPRQRKLASSFVFT